MKKYRIIQYYDEYLPQVYGEDNRWHDIGYGKSYKTVKDAESACVTHKHELDKRVVKEFEL